jgi:superfamily II DNA helicase RecQ
VLSYEGGGKSVVYQLPCHTREFGFTVVVCPLLALAADQVDLRS